jgi:hypothetical protein
METEMTDLMLDNPNCGHGYREASLCPACTPLVWGKGVESAEPLAVTLARIEATLARIEERLK